MPTLQWIELQNESAPEDTENHIFPSRESHRGLPEAGLLCKREKELQTGKKNMSQPLWAPWRMEYILGPKPDSCVLCLPPDDLSHDEDRLVLHRGKFAFVIMNKYPYNSGHIMVAPLRHVMDLPLLTMEESLEIMELLKGCTAILREHCNPQGINVGLNLGEAAGAGIRDHLHFHLVPRWNGDSSFMAVLSETRVIPQHLASSYGKLKPLFARLHTGEPA